MNTNKELFVEFFYNMYKANGKKITKTALRKIGVDDLAKIISSDSELSHLYTKFVNLKSEQTKDMVHPDTITRKEQNAPTSAEAEIILSQIVNNLMNDPTNFINIIKLKEFLAKLPHGTIASNKLIAEGTKLLQKTPIATLILNYAIEQQT